MYSTINSPLKIKMAKMWPINIIAVAVFGLGNFKQSAILLILMRV